MSIARVFTRARRARPFFARHPWVFAGSIGRIEGDPAPGDEVELVSHEGAFIARGLFNPHSAIRVRLYRWDPGPLDEPFWRARIEAAARLRADALGLARPGSAYRLVFSESDGLSGLTVDRFDRWLVAQFTSLALASRRDVLLPILAEVAGCEGVWLRSDRAMAEHEGMTAESGPALGTVPESPVTIEENGLAFEVDLRAGQKTGFYLDQRDNRLAAARYASGRRVLDLFCYTGGFALSVLKHGGAEHVLGFDSSAPAIEQARRNAVANGIGTARFEEADVFDALESLRAEGRTFGMVVCDPPRFARSPRELDDALRGYLRLNRLAVDAVEPGGILATCSCSGLVDRTMFADLLGRVAELSGRPIQLLEQRGAAPDHPVSASCLETDYLKCFLCRVG
jgi:23S rRNA (cytosine1962-C5)-methyltransferase